MSDQRANTRELMLRPNSRGRFTALSDGRVLAESYTPVFEAARVLQDEGVSGDEVLEVRHEGSSVVSMRITVATAAVLTVEESDRDGLRVRRYRPMPSAPGRGDRTAVFSGPMPQHNTPGGAPVLEENL